MFGNDEKAINFEGEHVGKVSLVGPFFKPSRITRV